MSKVITRLDRAYQWVLEGHGTAAPQEFPFVFNRTKLSKRLLAVKHDELSSEARARADTQAQLMLVLLSCCVFITVQQNRTL